MPRLTDAEVDKALDLLDRAAEHMEQAPDAGWWKEYYTLTGVHAILTDEGWMPGDGVDRETEEILDEVNAPV